MVKFDLFFYRMAVGKGKWLPYFSKLFVNGDSYLLYGGLLEISRDTVVSPYTMIRMSL